MPPPKSKALDLQQFHRMVPDAEPPQDSLPEGPTAGGSPVRGARRWITSDRNDGDGGGGASKLSLEEYKKALDACLSEYLLSFDLVEAVRCINELRSPEHAPQVVKRGVLRAMDKTDRERELIAVLFASLAVRGMLSSAHVAAGFQSLAESLEDTTLDTPSAVSLLAHFVADAVLDSITSRVEIDGWPEPLRAAPLAAKMLAEVDARLADHSMALVEPKALRAQLRPLVHEYLSSHDGEEVRRRLNELGLPPDRGHELVRVAVEIGLERKDRERELVCQLLSELYANPLPPAQVVLGFEALLARIDDLTIDNPSAPAHLSAFLVRAISDDVLSPAFVRGALPQKLVSVGQAATLSHARAQLAASHFSSRRRNVWGRATDATVDSLKQGVVGVVREYLSSGDVGEALLSVRELDAPAFHHELVKRLVVLSLDGGAREHELARALTARACKEDVLSAEQLALGCHRAVEAEPDLRLDNPRAPELIADFIESAAAQGLLPDAENWTAVVGSLRPPTA